MGAIERVDPAEAGLNAERLKRIPAYFDTYIQKRKLPCVAALVARGGQVAHLSFQGSTEMGGGRPIDADTIYRIYSMTKPVTSVAAMMLFEEGALRLDHEVYRYIPEFKDVMVMGEDGQLHKPARAMTVRDLFLHTSGLTYSFIVQTPVDAIYRKRKLEYSNWDGDLKSFCEALAQAPLVFSPGDRWNYSNSTDVLGRVVEVASGMSLDRFFQTRIFSPLGMKNTGIYQNASPPPGAATGYSMVEGKPGPALDWDMSWAGGAGAMFSTVGDLYLWNEARSIHFNQLDDDGVQLATCKYRHSLCTARK